MPSTLPANGRPRGGVADLPWLILVLVVFTTNTTVRTQSPTTTRTTTTTTAGTNHSHALITNVCSLDFQKKYCGGQRSLYSLLDGYACVQAWLASLILAVVVIIPSSLAYLLGLSRPGGFCRHKCSDGWIAKASKGRGNTSWTEGFDMFPDAELGPTSDLRPVKQETTYYTAPEKGRRTSKTSLDQGPIKVGSGYPWTRTPRRAKSSKSRTSIRSRTPLISKKSSMFDRNSFPALSPPPRAKFDVPCVTRGHGGVWSADFKSSSAAASSSPRHSLRRSKSAGSMAAAGVVTSRQSHMFMPDPVQHQVAKKRATPRINKLTSRASLPPFLQRLPSSPPERVALRNPRWVFSTPTSRTGSMDNDPLSDLDLPPRTLPESSSADPVCYESSSADPVCYAYSKDVASDSDLELRDAYPSPPVSLKSVHLTDRANSFAAPGCADRRPRSAPSTVTSSSRSMSVRRNTTGLRIVPPASSCSAAPGRAGCSRRLPSSGRGKTAADNPVRSAHWDVAPPSAKIMPQELDRLAAEQVDPNFFFSDVSTLAMVENPLYDRATGDA